MNLPAIEGGTPVREKPLEAWPVFTDEEKELVLKVLNEGRISSTAGTITRTFEAEFSRFIGSKYAVAVFNGTASLHTALAAIGVGPGDEVITTPFSFVASATSILHQNAIPIFGDIEMEHYNLDPESVRERITEKTKAVIVVHLAGHPAEMDEFKKIAKEYGLYLIEDCAQAIGSEYRGSKVGSLGDLGAFSFYQSKNLTTGEGGMVTTSSNELWEKVRLLIDHGQTDKYYHKILGWNYRMTELQAALGLGQLRRIDKLNRRREEIARIYSEELGDIHELKLPTVKDYVKHTWHIYQVLLKTEKMRIGRDFFIKALRAENVLVQVAYPRVIYDNPLFRKLNGYGKGCPWACPFYGKKLSYHKGLAPNAEYVAERIFTLPTFPFMGDDDVMDIVKAIKKVTRYYSKRTI